MAYPQKVSAVLLDSDAGTLVRSLPEAFNFRFGDPLNNPGQGACSVAIKETAVVADMVPGRYVQVSVVGVPDPVFTFKIEGNPQYEQIRGRTGIAEVATFAGRGWGAVWDEAIQLPEGDLAAGLDASWRLWSFASPGFPNAGAWGAATEVYEYLDGVAAERRVVVAQSATDELTGDPIYDLFPAPLAFPWPLAPQNSVDGPMAAYTPTYWIIAPDAAEGDVGFGFFRAQFTLASAQPVTFDVTGDNFFTLYVEGVPILGEKTNTFMWQGWKDITIELPAGTYTVGAVVENIYADLAFNPYGLLAAFYISAIPPGEVAFEPYLPVLTSDDSWVATFRTDEWPGYTPGQLLDQFVTENVTRGALLQFGILTCADFLDSAGDPWDSSDLDTETEYIPSFAARIGATGLDVLDKLHQEGWIDWHFHPDSLNLDVWAQGSAGAITDTEFVEGVNIGEDGLQRGATRPYANALLVQWGELGQFVWVEDATAIATYGTRVEDIYVTDAATQYEATRLGRVELLRRTGSGRASIRLQIEPTGTNDVPYVDFGVGDYVEIPTEDGGTEFVRVLTIAAETDVKGYARWSLELNAPWLDPQQATRDLLRNLGGKSMGTVRDLGIVRM